MSTVPHQPNQPTYSKGQMESSYAGGQVNNDTRMRGEPLLSERSVPTAQYSESSQSSSSWRPNTANTQQNNGGRYNRRDMSQIQCYYCNEVGHVKRNCAKLQQNSNTPRAHGSRTGADRYKIYANMTVGLNRTPCLIDTGCEASMVPLSLNLPLVNGQEIDVHNI